MGVLALVEEVRIELGEGKVEIIGGVGRRGVANQGGGIGTGRDDRPVMGAWSTKYQLNTIEVHNLVTL